VDLLRSARLVLQENVAVRQQPVRPGIHTSTSHNQGWAWTWTRLSTHRQWKPHSDSNRRRVWVSEL